MLNLKGYPERVKKKKQKNPLILISRRRAWANSDR